MFNTILVLAFCFLLTACATSPNFRLNQMGLKAFDNLKRDQHLSKQF